MPKAATATVMPSEKTWNAILRLAHDGQDCEKRIDDLQKARADLKGRLAEKGLESSESPSWKSLGSSFALVELTLESERARLKNLSRQSNALVSKAAQARILEDEDVDAILAGDPPPEAPLYDTAMKAAQKAGFKPNVGEPDAEPKRGKAKSSEDARSLADVPVTEILSDSPDAIAKLAEAKVVTLADVETFGKKATVDAVGADLSRALWTRIQQMRSMEPAPGENGQANGKHTKRGRKARDN